jgi:nucleoside-diphosphate-sugar epimerase
MSEWAILGCGYVGTRLARRLLEEGHSVRAYARHTDKLAPLAQLGARLHTLDATKSRQFGPALYGARSPVVVYSIPSLGNMPAGEPIRRATEAALAVGATRFIYLSSTAVYGPTVEGEVVDEASPLALSDGEAMPRVADESAVEGAHLSGLSTVILRLSAVYGPGRGVRERLKAGNYKLIDEGEHTFSRVHVDDVVGIIMAAADRAPNPAVYCVADDRPTTQREYAEWLGGRLGTPAPPSVASLAPGKPRRPVRNRAVANTKVKSELSYVFRYPTYLEGELAVEAETATPAASPVTAAPAPATATETPAAMAAPAPVTTSATTAASLAAVAAAAPIPAPTAPTATTATTATPGATGSREVEEMIAKVRATAELLQRQLGELEALARKKG